MVKRRKAKRPRMLAPPALVEPPQMKEVTARDCTEFRRSHSEVTIEDVKVSLRGPWTVKETGPPKEYSPERTTVWSFPDRGSWATHAGNYRGNWSPYIPRNLILRYSKPGELVLDQMMGSGTTLVECRLLGREGIGVDINPEAVMVARDRLDFSLNTLDQDVTPTRARTFVGDARNLNRIPDGSVDLIATHPPYASIVSYSKDRIPGDLSSIRSIESFVAQVRLIAAEAYRVLREGGHCAILMGDTRRHKHAVPIAVRVMQAFLDAGFVLREDVIKAQWNMKSTRERWAGRKYDFLLLAHEHLFVFRKPTPTDSLAELKESRKWWS